MTGTNIYRSKKNVLNPVEIVVDAEGRITQIKYTEGNNFLEIDSQFKYSHNFEAGLTP